MAKAKETEAKQADDSVLVSAAKVVGGAAGALASLAGVAPEKAPAPPRVRAATRAGRIPPSNKTRLPRRAKKKLQTKALKAEKKAAQKAA
jgi:hypothetical protein